MIKPLILKYIQIIGYFILIEKIILFDNLSAIMHSFSFMVGKTKQNIQNKMIV